MAPRKPKAPIEKRDGWTFTVNYDGVRPVQGAYNVPHHPIAMTTDNDTEGFLARNFFATEAEAKAGLVAWLKEAIRKGEATLVRRKQTLATLQASEDQ